MIGYPFRAEEVFRRSKQIKKALLADGRDRVEKRIAILGGSTTHDIVRMLEVFLLDEGIRPVFYESEYAKYYEDAVFGNPELDAFSPDVILVHTTFRNLERLPSPAEDIAAAETLLSETAAKLEAVWQSLYARFACPVLQNNFELPPYRILGNLEATDPRGTVRFVNRLNEHLAKKAEELPWLHIHDLQYVSATCGLDAWHDEKAWSLYKYTMGIEAIPAYAYSLHVLIKALFGKNKKALALDLDNTLWGGVVGDDGVDGIEIGEETAQGESFKAFQTYLKKLREIGVMLTVDSKNEEENALAGLSHPDGVLKPEDMAAIRANWEPKSENLVSLANELSILPEAFVFADDNPAEREIVRAQVPDAAVPELTDVTEYIRILDRAGYFAPVSLSEDDLSRNRMMAENRERKAAQATFADYGEYLTSLEMTAEITPFEELYYPRITQLTNKSNQFNLTTKRYTEEEIKKTAEDADTFTFCGRLTDRFGDNGIVSLVIGSVAMQLTEEKTDKEGRIIEKGRPTGRKALLIDLWLMSCRVLKRDMEFAMMDAVAEKCIREGISDIFGYYYPTAKNKMVKDFYQTMGFAKVAEDEKGNTVWKLSLPSAYTHKNRCLKVE